jgi:hypothetical protein
MTHHLYRCLRGKLVEGQKAAEMAQLSDRREHARELVALQVASAPECNRAVVMQVIGVTSEELKGSLYWVPAFRW